MEAQTEETWRPVVGLEALYEVSDSGHVRSLQRGSRLRADRVMRLFLVRGYPKVALRKGDERIRRKVHCLVAEAFIGPVPLGHEIDHLDGDRKNCTLSNLEYVTRAENCRRAWARRKAARVAVAASMLLAGRGEGGVS